MKRLIPVVAAACLLFVQGQVRAVHAQEPMPSWPSAGIASQRISMGVGKSKIVELPQDAAEIFVANPKVANAVVRSPRKLYIIGMDSGQTSVFAMDRQGRQIDRALYRHCSCCRSYHADQDTSWRICHKRRS